MTATANSPDSGGPPALLAPIAALGAAVLRMVAALGRIAIYTGALLRHIVTPPFYPRELGIALIQIGWLSLPVVGMTTLFTGAALALQIYARLRPVQRGVGGAADRRHRDGARARARPRRADGGGTRRLLHRRGDRHHAGDRADRRAGAR